MQLSIRRLPLSKSIIDGALSITIAYFLLCGAGDDSMKASTDAIEVR